MRRIGFGVLLTSVMVAMSVGCSSSSDDGADSSANAITDSPEGVHHLPAVTAADFVNQDPACAKVLSGTHSTPISPAELAAAEPELSQTGNIPLPSRGPEHDVDGRPGPFWPAKGYVEGGHFAIGTAKASQEVDPSAIQARTPGTLRVVEFNVNRGNTLDDLVKVMKVINADVYLIIETDFYGLNSAIAPAPDAADQARKRVVIGREMARALGTVDGGFYYFSGSEFYERLSPKGAPKSDESPENDATGVGRMGTSGTTIISRYPILEGGRADVPMFVAQGGHDWSSERVSILGKTLGQFILKDDLQAQPRCGQRMGLSATVAVPSGSGTKNIKFLALHTENKSNASIRAAQFDYVIYGGAHPLLASDQHELAIMAGDLNTLELGEGAAFRDHLKGPDATLIDTSSVKGASADKPTGSFQDKNTKTDAFGRIDWMVEQPGTDRLAVQNYAVSADSGGSDHHPIWTDFSLSAATGK